MNHMALSEMNQIMNEAYTAIHKRFEDAFRAKLIERLAFERPNFTEDKLEDYMHRLTIINKHANKEVWLDAGEFYGQGTLLFSFSDEIRMQADGTSIHFSIG